MKIKLVETAKPISKIESNLSKYVFPVFARYGFTIKPSLLTKRNQYEYEYQGIYKDAKREPLPFTITVNTTHKAIDDYNMDIFLKLSLNGEIIELGACNSKSPEDVQSLLSANANDIINSMSDHSYEELLPSRKGDEEHTRKEWKALFDKNQKEMTPTQFGSWWNNVYPL